MIGPEEHHLMSSAERDRENLAAEPERQAVSIPRGEPERVER
jgi:hypothetical protein